MSIDTYSLDEFKSRYDLDQSEAERIFRITGPAKADVDRLMAVRSRREAAKEWILDPYTLPPIAGS